MIYKKVHWNNDQKNTLRDFSNTLDNNKASQ